MRVVGTTILQGDCLEVLRDLPDESVHCVVTSPPYWGLRDYGTDGQLGLEPHYQDHVDAMVRVFREVRRVLRKDGTLWLNYGDCYATAPNGRSAAATKAAGNDDRTFRDKPYGTVVGGLKAKDLVGMPWRVALALQADGWWLRQDIIWHKPNPMPESVRDRCTKAHEYLFMFAKSERYYFDAEAVKEPIQSNKGNGKSFRGGGSYTSGNSYNNHAVKARETHGNAPNESGTRNRRSVWTVATKPFKEAHFATFPPDLIEPCIKAGCPAGGVVLDPFGGAGTTGLVANRLGREAILIDLNPSYCEMAARRIESDQTAQLGWLFS